MTSKLCLHGVHIADPESFAADVARLLQGRVIRGRLREKEYGEGKSARFRRSLLRERDGQFPCQIHLLEGILLAEGSLVALYDVEFAYEHGAERQVMELVDRLLSEENEYTLAEPDPALRLAAYGGPRLPASGRQGPAQSGRSSLSGLAADDHQLVLVSAVIRPEQ